jgi:hypothetical protein
MRARPGTDEDWRITSRDGGYMEVEVRCSDLRQEPTVGGLVVSMGGRYGQGYLLSGPLHASQAEEMVQAGRSLLPRLSA